MKKLTQLLVLAVLTLPVFHATLQAQWSGASGTNITAKIRRFGNVGIGAGVNNTASVLSPLSICGYGNALHKISVTNTNTGNATNNSVGIYATSTLPSGSIANRTTGIVGSAPSGFGYTTGVWGISTSPAPGAGGRAYGVVGQASNGTSGYNYGVWGQLDGINNGAGVLGLENSTAPNTWSGNTGGKWAGYFVGNTGITNKLVAGTYNTNNGTMDIEFGQTGSGEGIGSKRTATGNQWGLDFYTAHANRMNIRNDGKVAIGDQNTITNTNSPITNSCLLYVRNGILTEQLIIETHGVGGWADYVFEEEYDLLSLERVEDFIEENGHLPNIPSAQQIVEDGGFEVKKMTVLHQEKIEEIYLHLIELNKKVTALETENAALKLAAQTAKNDERE